MHFGQMRIAGVRVQRPTSNSGLVLKSSGILDGLLAKTKHECLRYTSSRRRQMPAGPVPPSTRTFFSGMISRVVSPQYGPITLPWDQHMDRIKRNLQTGGRGRVYIELNHAEPGIDAWWIGRGDKAAEGILTCCCRNLSHKHMPICWASRSESEFLDATILKGVKTWWPRVELPVHKSAS